MRDPTPTTWGLQEHAQLADARTDDAVLEMIEGEALGTTFIAELLSLVGKGDEVKAHFSVRVVFGRPILFASRAVGEQFLATHYRRFSGQPVCRLPLATIPDDYDDQLRHLRQRLHPIRGTLAQYFIEEGAALSASAATAPSCRAPSRPDGFASPAWFVRRPTTSRALAQPTPVQLRRCSQTRALPSARRSNTCGRMARRAPARFRHSPTRAWIRAFSWSRRLAKRRRGTKWATATGRAHLPTRAAFSLAMRTR